MIDDIILLLNDGYCESHGYNSGMKKYLKNFREKELPLLKTPLSYKIKHLLEKYIEILSPFMKNIFSINGMTFNAAEDIGSIAKNLAKQRNNFAHGTVELASENIPLTIAILEWLICCIIFDLNGYDKKEICEIINNLFDRGINLERYYIEKKW